MTTQATTIQSLYIRIVQNAKERATLRHEVSKIPEPSSEVDKKTLALMVRMVQDCDSEKLEKIRAILES